MNYMAKKVFLFLIVLVTLTTTALANIPDNQCYQMAANKDNALQNMGAILQGSGIRENPCTGQKEMASTYYDLKGGVTQIRSVYENGDAEGRIGLTKYLLCHSSGTAKVLHRIYGPNGIGYGFWFNFPFDDDSSTWIKEKETCNTVQ